MVAVLVEPGAHAEHPSVRTWLRGNVAAVHEIFDDGDDDPYALVSTQLHDDGTIGAIDFVQYQNGDFVPCVKTTLPDHAHSTHELFSDGAFDACVRVDAAMHDGRIGAVALAVAPGVDLTIRIGARMYQLVEGKLVEL